MTRSLDRNGGHSPECEGSCHPSCPIGQERRREANERARAAQAAWSRPLADDDAHCIDCGADIDPTRCSTCGSYSHRQRTCPLR